MAERRSATWHPEVGDVAHDVAKGCEVRVVVGPGVYSAHKWWVRPMAGGNGGWLASSSELEPSIGDRP